MSTRTRATGLSAALPLLILLGCNEGTDGPGADPDGAAGTSTDGGSTTAPAGDARLRGAGTPMTPAPYDMVTGPRPPVLPVVWITADGKAHEVPNDFKITARLKVIESPDAEHASLDKAAAEALAATVGFGPRGSTSSTFPQKAFGIEFRDDKGLARKQAILDLHAGEDFALVPCWNEQTCMRNALAYAMGRQFGQWNPRLRFVELYLEGSYFGVYQLTEVIRQDRNRVAIAEPGDQPGTNDITGGYIFRREVKGPKVTMPFVTEWAGSVEYPPHPKFADDPYKPKSVWQYHYPNEARITDNQKKYLKDYMDRFEAAMKGPEFASPEQGYRKWIDVKSFAEYFLIGEVTNNVDWYFKSFYLTKDRDDHGGKLHLGPVWDFNYALGNADYRDGFKTNNWIKDQTVKFAGECTEWLPLRNKDGGTSCRWWSCFDAAARPNCWNQPYVPFWIEKLWAEPSFQNDMKCRWNELRKSAFDIARLHKWIEDWRAELRPHAMKRHFARWPTLAAKISPNHHVPMSMDPQMFFDEHVDWLKQWVKGRIEWLDANLPGTCK